jgi:tetratricopeptide (TPR) repeat protein
MLQLLKNTKTFDTISKYSLGALLFLLPIFFVPAVGFGPASAKYALFYTLTTVAFLAFLVARLSDKKIVLPKKSQTIALGLVALATVLAAIFTVRVSDSFVGFGYEPTTALSVILFVLIALLSSVYSREESSVSRALKIVVSSVAVLFVYQIIRLFAPADALGFGTFSGTYGNLLGKWNDVAALAGLVVLAAFVSFNGQTKKTILRTLPFFVVALFILQIASFTLVFGMLAFLVAVSVVSDAKQAKKLNILSKKSWNTYRALGLLFVVATVLYMFVNAQSVRLNSQGNILRPNVYKIVQMVPNYFGGVPTEVRPGISTSFGILAKEIKANPVFGAGPNRFVESWVKNRPLVLGQTPYWATDFNFAVGYIPTLFVTTGIVGILALAYLLLLATMSTVRSMLSNSTSRSSKVIAYATAYLLILSIVYVPATALLVYLFFGLGYIFSKDGSATVLLKKNKITTYTFVATIVFLVLFFAGVGSVLAKEYLAARYYVKSAVAVQTDKNIDTASLLLKKAISLRPHDVYYRGYSEISGLKAQVIAAQASKDGQPISQEARADALREITTAKEYADKAIASNPKNYINYQFAGSIYQIDPETNEKAIELFTKSLELYPYNPNAYFAIAKSKAALGDQAGAIEFLKKTLEVGPLQTEALLAAAQISIQDKKTEEALTLLIRAYQSDRSRSDILLSVASIQAGELKDQKAATETLEYAVGTNPSYIDGRYALATLYASADKYEDAANLLVGIIKINEKTTETLTPIIEKLRKGVNPFTATESSATKATSTPDN